ncbi:GHKL domain-containing protein [Butyricicoccus sp. AM32-19]|uniref:sensor histidine kinase n=1 Tax=Butyricicoccus sp. AM32-19 TaxID=2292296 RepID=UPI000E4FEE4E|nr:MULTISPECIES: GHKL domain-containing protein [unclassified Butyricicoccus]RHS36791.1 GHKL domain-containing protein [Butyricicoccus sp. AF10-3]RHT28052.1 GHKL domain-containing protein [Butyricicoccus sp. AM32-19]
MNFWFEMAVNAVEVTLILSFLVQYFGYKTETSAKYWGTALIWILSFCIVAFFSWTHLYENYASSLQILVNILFCVTLLRGNIFQKIFVSAFTMGLVAITATLTTLLVAKLSGNQVAFLLSHFSGIRVTSICLTKLLFFVITRIILRIKESGKLKGMDVIALVIVPMLSDLAITLMMYAAIQEPSIQTIVLYAVGIVLILNIVVYFLFIRLGKAGKIKTEMALLALQNECLQENAKDIENMYDTVRALRHDLKNHLLCILSMAEERDVEGIKQYTGQLLQQQNTVNKLIMFSGSKVLDAIINSKSAAAERAGVRLSAIITTPLAGISPEDITIILGNALDNAIRAAKDSQRKVVDIHIQPQGAYSSIVIANDIAHPVLSDNPALRTTKNIRYRHGFGIQNMRQAVERNQGLIRFYEQNDRFICDILLLNVQSRNE